MPKLLQSSHTRPDQMRKLPRQAQQEQVAPSDKRSRIAQVDSISTITAIEGPPVSG